MTIKQQGGIFGRNPTFNDVEVEGTLTGSVSGNVTASSGSSSFQKIGIQNTSPTAPLTIGYSGAEAQIQINNSGGSRMFYAGAFSENEGIVRLFNSSDVETVRIPAESTAGVHTYFNAGNVGVGTTNPSAKFSVSGGNISVDSGYGIDFSATSDGSGATNSELFDDYEEGTFNPTYTTSGTDFDSVSYSVRYGNYVKIGSLIFVTGFIRTSSITVGSASGNVKIGGMPFARSGSMSPPGICQGASWSGDVPRSCISFTDSTLGLYYRTGGNTDDQAVQVADLDASGNNDLYFSCSFRESY
jgi:hypothetical protein